MDGVEVGALPLPQEASQQSEDGEIVTKVTAIVREADDVFQRVGGGSRHWVRDCFLPLLNRAGFEVVQSEAVTKLRAWLNRWKGDMPQPIEDELTAILGDPDPPNVSAALRASVSPPRRPRNNR